MGLTPVMFGHLLGMLGALAFIFAGISAGILRAPAFGALFTSLGLVFSSLVVFSWLFHI